MLKLSSNFAQAVFVFPGASYLAFFFLFLFSGAAFVVLLVYRACVLCLCAANILASLDSLLYWFSPWEQKLVSRLHMKYCEATAIVWRVCKF